MGSSGGLPDPASFSDDKKETSYVKEAFNLQYNWIALAGAGAFALVTGSLLPVLLAGGLEMMYLAIVPQNSQFQRLVRSWKFHEQQQHHKQKLDDSLHTVPSDTHQVYN